MTYVRYVRTSNGVRVFNDPATAWAYVEYVRSIGGYAEVL
jgi:hypothetical protein